MKKIFRRKKKSGSEIGSLASGRSASGYNISPKKDLTKLHKAAFENDVAKLKSVLKKADVNQLDKENRTALHLACAQGNAAAVRVLVSHPNCKINLCDNDRRSALMKCVQCQFNECLEILIKKHADVNLSDVNGSTALHLAAAIPSNDACSILVDCNADVHAKNKDGSTPLHIAASAEGSEQVMASLLDDGASVDAVDNNGKTALMVAASRGYLDIVKLLLQKKADANIKDKRGWSADDYASMSGHHPISLIIFEFSQKQGNEMKSNSSPEDHVYSTVAKSSFSKTNDRKINKDDFELSCSDEDSHSLSKSSNPDKGFLSQPTQAIKKPVNVLEFLKQRQGLQANSTADNGDNLSDVSSDHRSSKSEPEDDESETDYKVTNKNQSSPSAAHPNLRSAGYSSNSTKGGVVSPAKPPLPLSGSIPSSPPVKHLLHNEDESVSPWDSEEDEVINNQNAKPEKTSSLQFITPDKNLMAKLGLSEEDMNEIYGESSDDSLVLSSVALKKEEKDKSVSGTLPSANASEEDSKLNNFDEHHNKVSEESLSWDEDESEKNATPQKDTSNYFVGASMVKFDDELSEKAEFEKPKTLPTSELKKVGVFLDSETEDESSSSWDSDEKSQKNMNSGDLKRQSNMLQVGTSLQISPVVKETEETEVADINDNEEDDDSTESESIWEAENRKKKELKQQEALLEKMNNQNHLLEEEQLKARYQKDQNIVDFNEQKSLEQDHVEDAVVVLNRAQINTKKALAMEAAAKVRKKQEERMHAEEEEEQKRAEEQTRMEEIQRNAIQEKQNKEKEIKKMEEERKLLAEKEQRKIVEEEQLQELTTTQDKEKIEAALQEALNGSVNASDSEFSELDDSFLEKTSQSKMGDARVSFLPVPSGGFKSKDKTAKQHSTNLFMNGNDPSNWTATETESDDDLPVNIPTSLQSSQLSESLIRSGERGKLEREAADEKRRAIDAMEKLDYARNSIESLNDQLKEYKQSEKDWMQSRDELQATIRRLNFEHTRLKEQLSSSEVELKMTQDRLKRVDDQLELEGNSRRKQEVTIRELRNELKLAEESLRRMETERDKLVNEIQRNSLHEQVSRDNEKIAQEIQDESAQKQRFDALNLLMQDREQELKKMKAERDALDESCQRYKDELQRWHSKEGDKSNLLGKLNEELNDKIQELTRDLRESEETLQQAALQYNMRLNLLQQANDVVTEQNKIARTERETAQRDLEILNDQDRSLKRKIEDLESKCRKEEEKSASLQHDLKILKERKEEIERKLHSSEVADNLTQLEANNLRTSLTHKESLLAQAIRDKEETKENLRRLESEVNELRRENAKSLGRVETLQTDVTQQEGERMRLRRELEEARNFGTSSLTAQQGKLSDIMADHQKERIELEKVNAQLNQQVAHLRQEIERINEEKMKKDEELNRAQQDRIETHKHLSFIESSMAQVTETQCQLQQDKQRISSDLNASRARCSSMETRADESNKLVESLRSELENEKQSYNVIKRDLQNLQYSQSRDKDSILRLEDQLKEANTSKERLQSELETASNRERDAKEDLNYLSQSRLRLDEELIAKLQEEKMEAQDKMRTEADKCRLLQTEADGHRKMWESEVKSRSKLAVQFMKANKERKDALALVESYKNKLTKISLQSKTYRAKYEAQKKHHLTLEDQIDQYSKKVAASRLHTETSESEYEGRLSQMSQLHESERSKMDETIQELQVQLSALGRKLNKETAARSLAEKKLTESQISRNDSSASSVAELERERNQLREELKRARSKPSPPNTSEIVNAQVNAKLDQVNSWLEQRAVAQDSLEKLRCENEEKRVAEANRRADDLQRELDLVRRKMTSPRFSEGSIIDKDYQKTVREKIELQERIQRSDRQLEEYKAKLEHERKKYQQLYAGSVGGSISGNLGLSASAPFSLQANPIFASSSSPDVMSSTPKKDVTQPVLTQLRNKLDASIALKLAESRPSTSSSPQSERSDLNQRRPNEGRLSSNEYFLMP